MGGEDLPRLSQAVSRALMATGISVVMGASSNEPCSSCLRLVVVEQAAGRYRLEARQGDTGDNVASVAFATFAVSKDASLFEQARALAIEARQLIDSVPSKMEPEISRNVPKRDPALKLASVRKATTARAVAPDTADAVAPPPVVVVSPAPPETTGDPVPTPVVDASARAPVEAVLNDPVPPVLAEAVKPAVEDPKPTSVRNDVSLAASAAPVTRPAESPRRVWPWVATSAGAALGVAGGTCAILARQHYTALDDRTQSLASAQAHHDDGARYQTTALILGGVGAVALTTGIIALVRHTPVESSKTRVSLVPVESGLIFFAQGAL